LASGHEAFANIVNSMVALQLPLGKQESVKKPPRKMSTGPSPNEQENDVAAWNAKFNLPKDEKYIQSNFDLNAYYNRISMCMCCGWLVLCL
jgi:hypothetical protein